jgi:hypothetical protein
MDSKAFSSEVVLWIAAAYAIIVIVRSKTRYRARFMECVLVGLLLLVAAIFLPVYFGSIPISQSRP